MTLPVSRLVRVAVNLSPEAAAGRDFNNLLVIGDSDVISGLERIQDFAGSSEVAALFGANAPETKAAELYFGQSPQPASMSVGRWIRTASKAMLQGAILSSAQKALFNFTQVTAGGFSVTIDGVVHALTGLNFSTALNLNGVASIITAALAGAGTAIYDGTKFIIKSASAGAGIKASGLITFGGQPANADTITVNGISIEFVSASPIGNEVLIGASAQITAANLHAFLVNSISPNILAASYSISGLVITVTYASVGVAGNAFTLVEAAANVTVSGATLVGGVNPSSVSYATPPVSDTDVSGVLGLTSALGLPLVPGYAAESPIEAVTALSAFTSWYGVMFAASVMPTDEENLEILPAIEADSITRMFGVTIQDSGVQSSAVDNDLASLMKLGAYEQSFCEFSSSSPYAVASIFGRAFSVNFSGQNTTITLMYKQQPGVTPENIGTSVANVLKDKRCNVYAKYNNDTAITQYGVMSGPAYIDEIHGLDSMQNDIQTACFNVMYATTTKVPQTDQGDNQFVNAISEICQKYITNGLGAPGTWNGPSFGQILQGQFLKLGFYIFVEPIALQSQSDRDARKAPPFTIAFKLAGANQEVDVLMTVNR